MKKRFIKILVAVTSAVVLCYGALSLYAKDYYRADQAVSLVMQQAEYSTTDNIAMEITDDMVVLRPDKAEAGFIFYPGGKVEYTAYMPLVYRLAQNGIACVITEMPFNLAVLDINAADEAYKQLSDINRWYIGGHSLGGSMAASYIGSTENSFDGLVLLASYSTADLSQKDIDVLSVYGTEDKVLNMEKYAEYYPNLPENTTEAVIEGGNHAQFGSYGAQEGDGEAVISSALQWDITAQAITEFMGIETE